MSSYVSKLFISDSDLAFVRHDFSVLMSFFLIKSVLWAKLQIWFAGLSDSLWL